MAGRWLARLELEGGSRGSRSNLSSPTSGPLKFVRVSNTDDANKMRVASCTLKLNTTIVRPWPVESSARSRGP